MAFIRNTYSRKPCVLSRLIIASLFVFGFLTTSSAPSAADYLNSIPLAKSPPAEAPPATAPAISACPKPRGKPMQVVLQNLKGINLHIMTWPPGILHERDYPAALQPDNLIPLFSARIQKTLSDFVARDTNCAIPPIVVVPRTEIFKAIDVPNTLTVTVRVDIIDSARPKIAVLTVQFFRPDKAFYDYGGAVIDDIVTAIPLDLSDDDIASAVADFVQHSIGAPIVGGEP